MSLVTTGRKEASLMFMGANYSTGAVFNATTDPLNTFCCSVTVTDPHNTKTALPLRLRSKLERSQSVKLEIHSTQTRKPRDTTIGIH